MVVQIDVSYYIKYCSILYGPPHRHYLRYRDKSYFLLASHQKVQVIFFLQQQKKLLNPNNHLPTTHTVFCLTYWPVNLDTDCWVYCHDLKQGQLILKDQLQKRWIFVSTASPLLSAPQSLPEFGSPEELACGVLTDVNEQMG